MTTKATKICSFCLNHENDDKYWRILFMFISFLFIYFSIFILCVHVSVSLLHSYENWSTPCPQKVSKKFLTMTLKAVTKFPFKFSHSFSNKSSSSFYHHFICWSKNQLCEKNQ